jgi:hypothetical protein
VEENKGGALHTVGTDTVKRNDAERGRIADGSINQVSTIHLTTAATEDSDTPTISCRGL